jgi:hypothetical protein
MTRGTDCLPFGIGIIDSNVFLENIGRADYDFPCQDGTFPELCKAVRMFRRIARTIRPKTNKCLCTFLGAYSEAVFVEFATHPGVEMSMKIRSFSENWIALRSTALP